MDALRLLTAPQTLESDPPPKPRLFAIETQAAFSPWRPAMVFALIAIVCVLAARHIGRGEFDYNVDEAQHAVTGLFVADAMHDLPIFNAQAYAYHYYAQYPAVALVHWPPLFYLVEGLSFLTLGRTVAAARGAVLVFLALLTYEWFRLVEELQDTYTAVVATLLLTTVPLMLVFEKSVMLEIPSLALGVAAIREWIRYLDDGQRASLVKWALWCTAAMLCKQTSVYLFVFSLITLIVTGRWERVWNRNLWMAIAILALGVGPFYLLMLASHGQSVAQDLGSHQLHGFERVSYFFKSLPNTFTAPLLVLSLLGLVLSPRWNRRGQATFMLCWIAAGYLTFTGFGQKEARFAIYWFPPLAYFAAGLLTRGVQTVWIRRTIQIAAMALLTIVSVQAWRFERPYISGYQTAAARLVDGYGSGIVLFDGKIPGNFVFFMRSLDPRRQFLVLRKALYVNDVRKNENSQELLHSREEFLELFKTDGIRFIVVSENTPLDFPSQATLRELLQSDQFQLLGRFPIASNQPAWQGRSLLLYENRRWTLPSEKILRIRMLTLNHDVEVPLDQFDFVRNGNAIPAPPAVKQ